MAPLGRRQEAKLVVCLCKMFTACLTVLHDFWFKKILPLVSTVIQVRQFLSVLFLCYLVVLRVFSCTL